MRPDILTLLDPQAPVQDPSPNPPLSPHPHMKPVLQVHLRNTDQSLSGHGIPHLHTYLNSVPSLLFQQESDVKLTVRLFGRFHKEIAYTRVSFAEGAPQRAV